MNRAHFTSARRAACLAALAGLLAPMAAWAHPGHGTGGGLVVGLTHPLTGLDHLAAMLLAGLWAGMLGGRARWALPLAFSGTMLAGFALAASPLAGLAEGLIIASVAGLTAAAVLRLRAPMPLAMAALAVFGLGHGLAHGLEAPEGAARITFVVGFVATSLALQGLGLALARALPWRARSARLG